MVDIGVFVKTIDKIRGTLQILHNICPHIPRSVHRGAKFAYLNDVQSNDVKVVPFHKALLAPADETVITPISMDRTLEIFSGDASVDLVSPFADGDAATKKSQTRNLMCIPYLLLPYVIGQNLTIKAAIHILVPVMSSLGFECWPLLDFLLAAATFTTGNDILVTLLEDIDLGLESPLCLFDVINYQQTILYVQLPSLRPGTGGPSKATTAL